MLPEITQYEEEVTLVSDTGIQFMDFAMQLDARKEPAGEFVPLMNGLITRLFYNSEKDYYFYEPTPGAVQKAKPVLSVDMKSSLELLDSVWLPMPFFRFHRPSRFDEGPCNWARARLVRLPATDIDGNTHRLTIAFDTRIMPKVQGTAYLAPNDEDVNAGAVFRLAFTCGETRWFLDQGWVKEWLDEVFREGNAGKSRDDLAAEIHDNMHLAHYLNLLSLLRNKSISAESDVKPKVEIPEIRVVAKDSEVKGKPIPVDLVLDVGNSRTCGILIENHGQSGSGLKQNYVLQLRDLITPEHIYSQPFESCVEFAQASFGKDHQSVKSGRHDAFLWPTISRVGPEASRLAARRRGTEGSTGLSSPKRYLWDENSYTHGWRFNCAYVRSENEPLATAAPFSHLINENGVAHYMLDESERMPVFSPKYSRSSLMTFMLAEVLTQALSQINSPAQRARQGHAHVPRYLNSIILTVPPGMPQAERSLFNERMCQARNLVWASLGWYEGDDEPDESLVPKILVEWDEASCGQLVYLYTEVSENFAGHPEEFFAALARPDKQERDRITLATIDIGGGTTDLVITEYSLDGSPGGGSNAYIVPEQRFRDGFKVAGDDILLDVIQEFVLPSFESALRNAGVKAPDYLMSSLCGSESSLSGREKILRQQLNLQLFVPLGLRLLKAYEAYDPEALVPAHTYTYAELLADSPISDAVKDYVGNAVNRDIGRQVIFDLGQISIVFDLQALHRAFFNENFNICKTLAALCEVIYQYKCDALLLTGRPSSLPGVQAYVRKRLPLPPGRIRALHNYRTGGWYPFHRNGLIDDSKSTASVGAMLFLLCANNRIPNFYFRSAALKPYSTIKHIGLIDNNNVIKDADVVYRDVRAEDGQIRLPVIGDGEDATHPAVEMRGFMRLGFRQLRAERWAASPLYSLDLTAKGNEKFAKATQRGEVPVLQVSLAVAPPDKRSRDAGLISDRLIVERIESNCSGQSFGKSDVKLELNTLLGEGLSDSKYWLDSGSVKRK